MEKNLRRWGCCSVDPYFNSTIFSLIASPIPIRRTTWYESPLQMGNILVKPDWRQTYTKRNAWYMLRFMNLLLRLIHTVTHPIMPTKSERNYDHKGWESLLSLVLYSRQDVSFDWAALAAGKMHELHKFEKLRWWKEIPCTDWRIGCSSHYGNIPILRTSRTSNQRTLMWRDKAPEQFLRKPPAKFWLVSTQHTKAVPTIHQSERWKLLLDMKLYTTTPMKCWQPNIVVFDAQRKRMNIIEVATSSVRKQQALNTNRQTVDRKWGHGHTVPVCSYWRTLH